MLCKKCSQIPYYFISKSKDDMITVACECGFVEDISISTFLNQACPDLKLSDILSTIQAFQQDQQVKDNNSILERYKIRNCCDEDKKEEIDYYCCKCKKHICGECHKLKHVSHKNENLNTLLGKEKFEQIVTNFKNAVLKINVTKGTFKAAMIKKLEEEKVFFEKDSQSNVEKIEKFKKEVEDDIESINKSFSFGLDLNQGYLIFFSFLIELYILSQPIKNFFIMKNLLINSRFDLSLVEVTGDIKNDSKIMINYFYNDRILVSENPFEEGNEKNSNNSESIKRELEIKNDSVKSLELKPIKILRNHKTPVNSLLLLSDEKIISCSNDNKFKVFQKKKNSEDYEFCFTVKEHRERVINVIELDNDCIVSASEDFSAIIYSLKKDSKASLFDRMLKLHYKVEKRIEKLVYLSKVINLTLNRFAVSTYSKISIYSGEPPYSLLFSISKEISPITNMIQLKDRRILSTHKDGVVRFWDLNQRDIETDHIIKEIKCANVNGMKQIDDKRVVICEKEYVCIISTENYEIENIIKLEEKKFFFGAVCILNDNEIYVTFGNEIFLLNKKLIKVRLAKTLHKGDINDIIVIGINQIVTCSEDTTVIIWETSRKEED